MGHLRLDQTPEEYGGLGGSLLTYALAVEEIGAGPDEVPRGVINTYWIVPYMLMQDPIEEGEKQTSFLKNGER